MKPALRNVLVSACLIAGMLCTTPARAFDPILMFLIGMAREITYEAFATSQNPRAPAEEPLPEVYPGTMVEPSKLRAMIDESFVYLSERRRDALFQAFHDELIKPQNAAVRASMIAYFTEHALAVRMVLQRLSKLTENEMRMLSAEFAVQARTLASDDRENLRKVLEEGLLPVPPDLNKMLVAEIRALPPATAVAEPAPQTALEAKAAAGPGPHASKPVAERRDVGAVVAAPHDAPPAAVQPQVPVLAAPAAEPAPRASGNVTVPRDADAVVVTPRDAQLAAEQPRVRSIAEPRVPATAAPPAAKNHTAASEAPREATGVW